MAADRPVNLTNRLRVDTYQVQKTMYLCVAGKLKKTETLGLSPLFGNRFAAVKALRKIRRIHPTAKLEHTRLEFTASQRDARVVLLSTMVRAGQQGHR